MTRTMRAIVLDGYGGPEHLRPRDVPWPPMMPHNEVRIDVYAAGVNPFDVKLRSGCLSNLFPLPPGHILGSDVAGVVVEKGFDVTDLEIGDKVYGLLDPMRPGAYAEGAVTVSWLVRRMPRNLSFAEAASIPMAACTAWVGLVDLAKVGPGTRVLVSAAGGGVGSFAVQIAKQLGAWVAATASAKKADYVRQLGADEVIPSETLSLTDVIGDVDVVIDSIGGETILRYYPVLKRGGSMLVVMRGDEVEMADRERMMAVHGVTTREIAFGARPDILDAMRPLFESGALKPPDIRTFPLDHAGEAHREVEGGRSPGKTVLEVRR